jgi:hypothetical protein
MRRQCLIVLGKVPSDCDQLDHSGPRISAAVGDHLIGDLFNVE